MAEQPVRPAIPRPTVEPAPRIRPVEPIVEPVSRPIVENTEHDLTPDTPEVVYCECSNARCSGHFRRSFCTGTAVKGLVPSNRQADPMMVLCQICYDLTITGEPDLWTEVDGAMDKYHAATVQLDPDEEARRAYRLTEAMRAARSEGIPPTTPMLSVESVRASQQPQADPTVPVLDDSYVTTSQIPVLDEPKKE